MATIALVNYNVGEVVRRASDADIDPGAQTKSGYKWVPVEVIGLVPATEAQVREGPVTSILQDRVLDTYTIRDKTQVELDAEKDARVEGMDAVLLRIAFNHENRIRSQAGQQSVTIEQFKAAVRSLL